MKNFWKKTGWFMMCVLMIVISLVLQVGFGIIALLPFAVKVGIEATGAGITDMAAIQEMMMEYANDAASWGVFCLLYTSDAADEARSVYFGGGGGL